MINEYIVGLLFFLIGSITSGWAQEPVDSVLHDIIQTMEGTQRVDALNKSSDIYTADQPELTLRYATQALFLADSLNYLLGQADAFFSIGKAYAALDQRDRSIKYLRNAVRVAQEAGDEEKVTAALDAIESSYQTTVGTRTTRVLPRSGYRQRYFQLGIGYTLPKFLDQSSSVLRYRGHAASVTAGLHWANPPETVRYQVYTRFDYGRMSAFDFAFADLNFYRFEGNYTYERQLKVSSAKQLRWYIGGSVNGLWTLWHFENFSNNAFNNSFYFSLSPHFTLKYSFQLWKRDLQVSYSAFLPLLTFAVRPSYGTTRFPEFLDDERDEPVQQFLGSGRMTTLGNFARYSNTTALEYVLRNANRLRLSYTWNFVSYNEPRVVKSASHNITLSTMFNF